jgi:hypothetical protein
MDSDADFTDELATMLYELRTDRLATADVTAAITRHIVRWAQTRAWSVRTEGRVDVHGATDAKHKLGFVDVLIRRGDLYREVAIEIDSTDKPWSVVKLQHAAAAGAHAIWVRWGDDAWAGVYDAIDVIQLPVIRRTRRQTRTAQLSLWR